MSKYFEDNIEPDFGWSAPFDSRELEGGPVKCKNPDFMDNFLHRMAWIKVEHMGAEGDRDENGLPGWIAKRICNGCGEEFGHRVFYPDGKDS